MFGLVVLIALTIAACGNDDDTAVPPPTAVDDAPDEHDHEHEHDHGTEDQHDHATLVDAVPDTTIEVEVAGGKPCERRRCPRCRPPLHATEPPPTGLRPHRLR